MAKESYTFFEKLGSGVQGSVYKVRDNKGNYLAAKEFSFIDGPLNEIDMMMRMEHPHIVRGVEIFSEGSSEDKGSSEKSPNSIKIILIEELGKSFVECIPKFSSRDKIRVIYEIGTALQFLLENGIVHCDIKPDNILMINDRATLADLGIADYIDEKFHECESLPYRAPEYIVDEIPALSKGVSKRDIRRRNYGQAEIWSYGILCLDIISGIPFIMNTTDAFKKLISSKESTGTFLKRYFSGFDNSKEDIADLYRLVVDKLLQKNLDKRARTFSEFLRSDIFENNGFEPPISIGNYNERNETFPIIPRKDRKVFNVVMDWIFEVCDYMETSNRAMFLTLHLIRYKWGKYVDHDKEKDKTQLFAYSCLYLAHRVLALEMDPRGIEEISYDLYTTDQLIEFSSYIFIEEGGMINSNTLYDYLSSVDMLVNALKLTKKGEYYMKRPEELAQIIILSETSDEANKRRLKSSVNCSQVIKEAGILFE